MSEERREVCDEIKIFEGIQPPNLVKYYGVKVHKVRSGRRQSLGGGGGEKHSKEGLRIGGGGIFFCI